MEELRQLPQNQIRKAMALKASRAQLKALLRQYAPIFDDDPAIQRLVLEMRAKEESILTGLRHREDALDLLETVFQED